MQKEFKLKAKKDHKTQVGESLSLGYFSSFIFTPNPRLVVNSDKHLTGAYPSQPSRVWGGHL